MRYALLALLLLAACGGSDTPGPAAPAAPAAGPAPAADATPFEATDDSRRTAAIDFLAAVARRDRPAIASMTGEAALCEIIARDHPERLEGKDVQACTEEQVSLNAEALGYYEAAVPETFAAGDAQVSPLDAEQGIYLVTVEQAGGDPLSVIFLEVEQRRFVVFPRKKEE